ncbi:hypothetical protein B484DRAFT_410898, partial [Ochromonadaceae sp. CCMP2298]
FRGDVQLLLTFLKGCVASRICDPVFDAAVRSLLQFVGGQVPNFAKSMEGVDFRNDLLAFYETIEGGPKKRGLDLLKKLPAFMKTQAQTIP